MLGWYNVEKGTYLVGRDFYCSFGFVIYLYDF